MTNKIKIELTQQELNIVISSMEGYLEASKDTSFIGKEVNRIAKELNKTYKEAI